MLSALGEASVAALHRDCGRSLPQELHPAMPGSPLRLDVSGCNTPPQPHSLLTSPPTSLRHITPSQSLFKVLALQCRHKHHTGPNECIISIGILVCQNVYKALMQPAPGKYLYGGGSFLSLELCSLPPCSAAPPQFLNEDHRSKRLLVSARAIAFGAYFTVTC